MKCPNCGNEMKVRSYKYLISGASDKDTPTELSCAHELECVNPRCPGYGRGVTRLIPMDFTQTD